MNPDEFKVQVVNFEGDVVCEKVVRLDFVSGAGEADGWAALRQAAVPLDKEQVKDRLLARAARRTGQEEMG